MQEDTMKVLMSILENLYAIQTILQGFERKEGATDGRP